MKWTHRQYVIVCTRDDGSTFLCRPLYWSQKEAIDGALAMDSELLPWAARLVRWHAFKKKWGASVHRCTATVEI